MGQVDSLPSGRFRAVARVSGRRVTVGTYDYAYEAELAWLEAEQRAVPPEPSAATLTLHEHADRWLQRRRGALTKATVASYSTYVGFLGRDELGAMPVAALVKADVEVAVTRWADDGAGPATVAGRYRVLRAVLRDARANGLTDRDASDGVKLPTVPERVDAFLAPAQVQALLASAFALSPAWAVFVLCGVEAGLRWGEAAALTPAAVTEDRIHVRQVIERDGTVRPYPKGRRHRTVRMSVRLRTALRPLAAAVELERGADALLFTAPGGTSLDYANYRHRVWRTVRGNAVGLRKSGVRYHDLRHTYGSRLAAKGVPDDEIMRLMGHADAATTARYKHAAGYDTTAAWVAHALDGAPSPLAAIV